MKQLLIISTSPAVLGENNTVRLDVKFREGMEFFADAWGGAVSASLVSVGEKIPFGAESNISDLLFELILIQPERRISAEDLRGFDAVLCSGDSYKFFHLAKLSEELGIPLIFMIELDLETRIRIAFLDQSRGFLKRLYSALWILRKESGRRKAFRRAAGLQANGYPAYEAYRSLNENTLLYLDNRISADMLASAKEKEGRRRYLLGNRPLRLIHSGRLEPLKGSGDLVTVAKELARQNVDFELNIFGTGSLEEEMRRDVVAAGLESRVILHGAVDFKTVLVPFTRTHADIYLSCHRQSDPSCTYLEAMGCGVAVLGYSNRMWSALCGDAGAGWIVPLGQPKKMAQELVRLNAAREEIADACERSYDMARDHEFKRGFTRRLNHISAVL